MGNIIESDKNRIVSVLEKQREFFNQGKTRSYSFRVEMLKKLSKAISKYESEIITALSKDLGKSVVESYTSEIGFVQHEIKETLKSLKQWMKKRPAKGAFMLFPSKNYLVPEPYGVNLIIGPWNYPFQLLIFPLVSSIAAGNCNVLKPSEIAGNCSAIVNKMITETFDSDFIAVIEGGVDETQELLSHKFDYIFFTGSPKVGKIVMREASKFLTPVTLELGGKNPLIIEDDVDIKVTARRVAWAKFFNAGQTCIAPDYVFVKSTIKDSFISEIKTVLESFYGKEIQKCNDFGRIINEHNFDRLVQLIDGTNILVGGNYNKTDRYIEPTVVDGVNSDSKIMMDEIFGPILPLMEYDEIDIPINYIKNNHKPLALYLFTKKSSIKTRLLNETSSGAFVVNDALNHISNPNLPFGGVGNSGMGSYHGKFGFETFSHLKPYVDRSFAFDFSFKYPPYNEKAVEYMRGFMEPRIK
jgi:aldehyde dehydrogenase (NAD+)